MEENRTMSRKYLPRGDHRVEGEFGVDQKMALVPFDKFQQIERKICQLRYVHVDHSKALEDLMKENFEKKTISIFHFVFNRTNQTIG